MIFIRKSLDIKACTSCWNLYSSFPDLNIGNVWKQALILLNPAVTVFLSWPWEQFLHQPQLASRGAIGDGCSSASETQMSARAGIADRCDALIYHIGCSSGIHPLAILYAGKCCCPRQAAGKWSLRFLWLVLQEAPWQIQLNTALSRGRT